MTRSKFLAFFDVLSDKKYTEPEPKPEQKKGLDTPVQKKEIPTKEEPSNKECEDSETPPSTLQKLYEESVKEEGAISELLAEDSDLIHYGEGEENSSNIDQAEIEKNLILKADNFVKYLYEDNPELISLLGFEGGFRGIPTFAQYQKICKLSSTKVEQIEKEDYSRWEADWKNAFKKEISRGDHIRARLCEYTYGQKGWIKEICFEPIVVSSSVLESIEKAGLKPDIEGYKTLLDFLINKLKKLARNTGKESASEYNFLVYKESLPPREVVYYHHKDLHGRRYKEYIDNKQKIYSRIAVRGDLVGSRYHFSYCGAYFERGKEPPAKPNPYPIAWSLYWEYLKTTAPYKWVKSDPRIDYLLTHKDVKLRFNIFDKPKTKYSVLLPRKEQESHTYVVGGTKSGKSELLKYLAVQEILKGDRNSVLLDPHGDIANQIVNIGFLHPESVKNITYVDTSIKDTIGEKYDNLPCINPLEINRKYIDTREKLESVAYYLSLAFEEITGSENTVNMRAMLIPCLCVLLERKDTDLYDLDRFMDDDRNDDLVELGKSSPNRSHANYFQNKFLAKKTQSTKEALAIRLQVALNSSVFSKMTCGKTTIDFHEIVRGRNNHVIFRLNKENTSSIQRELGILIITTLMNAAFTTKENERIGVHLLIDEFQNFINSDMETILSECRKYKVYMTLAHQYIDQIYDIKIKKAILSNTNIKLIGSVGGNTVSVMKNNGEEKLEQEFVDNLRTGKFLIRIKSQGAFYDYLKVPPTLVDKFVKWVDMPEKREYLKEQYDKYYKPIKSKKTQGKAKKKTDKIDFNDF